jgi:hypothetical protein
MTQSKPFDAPEAASDASFEDILTQFEQSHHADGGTVEGTVVSVTPDGVFVDIGRKMDGLMPPLEGHTFKPGDKLIVSIRGRDEQGTYQLSTVKVEVPKDWTALEAAFQSDIALCYKLLRIVNAAAMGGRAVPVTITLLGVEQAARLSAATTTSASKRLTYELSVRNYMLLKDSVSDFISSSLLRCDRNRRDQCVAGNRSKFDQQAVIPAGGFKGTVDGFERPSGRGEDVAVLSPRAHLTSEHLVRCAILANGSVVVSHSQDKSLTVSFRKAKRLSHTV